MSNVKKCFVIWILDLIWHNLGLGFWIFIDMLPSPLKNLIEKLSQLPDIGPKMAQRLAFYFLNQNQKELDELSLLIKNIKERVKTCKQCFSLSENDLCQICKNPKRNQNIICVVENAQNIPLIEKVGQFFGVYHVLGGLISPPEGIGPEKLKIKELVQRLKKISPAFVKTTADTPTFAEASADTQGPVEIILAFNPTTEGDTTALYIKKTLEPLKIKITRLARGVSTGADLEYLDETTIISALLNRK